MMKPRVTVSSINTTFRRKSDIQHEVKQIVQRCEDCIEDAYSKNQINCKVPIPNSFNIKCVDPKDSMLAIHTSTIAELESRGFHVVIQPDISENRTILLISGWELLDEFARDDMKKYLAARMDPDFRASIPRKKKRPT